MTARQWLERQTVHMQYANTINMNHRTSKEKISGKRLCLKYRSDIHLHVHIWNVVAIHPVKICSTHSLWINEIVTLRFLPGPGPTAASTWVSGTGLGLRAVLGAIGTCRSKLPKVRHQKQLCRKYLKTWKNTKNKTTWDFGIMAHQLPVKASNNVHLSWVIQ